MNRSRPLLALVAVLITVAVSGCTRQEPSAPEVSTLVGAGANFPAPVYEHWMRTYTAKTPGVEVRFERSNSGLGIQRVTSGTAAFGATDEPLSTAELRERGLVQFPMVLGGVTVVANIGLDVPLNLSGPLLEGILFGDIDAWNHPEIVALNPGRTLPDMPILPIHRGDASGQKYLVAQYLANISRRVEEEIGVSRNVTFPTGKHLPGKEAVIQALAGTPGAIGYLEANHAAATDLTPVALSNREGQHVVPTVASIRAAAAAADWTRGLVAARDLTNQPGADTYPIAAATFLLLPREPSSEATGEAVREYMTWCLDRGTIPEGMIYAELPDRAKDAVRGVLNDVE